MDGNPSFEHTQPKERGTEGCFRDLVRGLQPSHTLWEETEGIFVPGDGEEGGSCLGDTTLVGSEVNKEITQNS